jgi:hypothetical protein
LLSLFTSTTFTHDYFLLSPIQQFYLKTLLSAGAVLGTYAQVHGADGTPPSLEFIT